MKQVVTPIRLGDVCILSWRHLCAPESQYTTAVRVRRNQAGRQ